MVGTVYVVLAFDTEGPATDPRKPEILSSWEDIHNWLAKFFDPSYRTILNDTYGRPLIASWFMLNWTGFSANPMRRDFGYHKVYDEYLARWGKHFRQYGDDVQWHYHHPPQSGVGNEWNASWGDNREYENIINRMIVDRSYFPVVYRAGGTIETNDSSEWLERWIPFDFSNRVGAVSASKVEADGRSMTAIVNWEGAPNDWSVYHPDPNDYRRPGSMKRAMARSLDLYSSAYVIREDDIELAFARAEEGNDVVLSAFEHDYRDRAEVIREHFLNPLAKVANRHPRVAWKYSRSLDAIASVLGRVNRTPPALTLSRTGGDVHIQTSKQLFSAQPWVAVRERNKYYRLDTTVVGQNRWIVSLEQVAIGSVVAIAGACDAGTVGIASMAITR